MSSSNDSNSSPEIGKFVGVMGPHTQRATERLRAGVPGDTLTRDQMAEIIRRDCSVGSLGYGNVNSAIRHTEKFHGVCWRWDRELQAWRCLNDVEKTKVQGGYNQSSRRYARRGIVVGTTVDVAKLDEATRQDHNLNMSAAGMIYLCAGGAFRKRMEKIGVGKLQEPDPEKLIEVMKRDT